MCETCKFMRKDKGLLEQEVSRCNRNFFIVNTCLTLLASWIISWFFFDLGILGKTMLVVILLAFPGYNYYKLYRRLEDYSNHPDYKSLFRLGKPSEVSEYIEKDLSKNLLFPEKSDYGFYKNNKLRITPNWIVIRGFFHFYVIHVTELIWVYIKQTKHSVNFIPTGSTYGVIFNSSNMRNMEVEIKEEMLEGKREGKKDSIIEIVHSIAPWAIYGFSEEIRVIWDKNPGALIQEVNRNILEIQKIVKKNGKKKKE